MLALAASCLLAWGCDAERGAGESVSAVQLRHARSLATAGTGATRPAREGAPLADARAASVEAGSRAAGAPSPAPPPPEPPAAAPARRTAAKAPAKPIELMPGANEDFDPAVVADVEWALNADDENAFATLVHEKKHVLPRNCRDWRVFRKRGFAPKSALGEQVDAGALVRCGALEFLARASSSRVTHVRDALVGAGPAALPAIVASATSKPALQARGAAASRGLTLAELLPSARTGTSEVPGRVAILEPASETSVILNAEVWGDINSDGIEDLLISVLNSSDDGSYFDMRLVEVTRTSPRARLTVLAVLQ